MKDLPVTKTTPAEAQKSAAQQPLLEERIRIRAYELFLARNREPGRENDDWFQAEAEVAQKPAETTE
jgi:hypothetical protein